MANRFPLIIDVTDKKLKELPIGDNLEVTNSIAFGNDTLSLNNGTIIINGNALTIPTDINQLTDVSSLLTVSSLSGVNIFGTNNILLVDAINNNIPYSVLSNVPLIPTDVSQLTDEQGLLGDGSTIVNGSSFSRLTKLSTVERDELIPETGDIIYNTTESAIQAYVDISDWSLDLEPQAVPGWISLYTPPLPPV